MRVFRVHEARLGAMRIREWRRRAGHIVTLLGLLLVGAVAGLVLLDQSHAPLAEKISTAVWNAANLITTLGDFSAFDGYQKPFMILAMFATLLVGGYAMSRLTGMLSSDDVMIYRENRIMERKLEHLANHVVVVGFQSLGELVAQRLHTAGETVLVLVGDEAQAAHAADRGHFVVAGSPGVFDDVLRHARLEHAKALVVTTSDTNNTLAIALLAHSLNASLPISAPGENPLRKELLQNAGATNVVIADELVANALIGNLTA